MHKALSLRSLTAAVALKPTLAALVELKSATSTIALPSSASYAVPHSVQSLVDAKLRLIVSRMLTTLWLLRARLAQMKERVTVVKATREQVVYIAGVMRRVKPIVDKLK